MYFKKVKRAQLDHCNICGKKAVLTWDHVPPKACGNGIPREYSLSLGCNDPEKTNSKFPWTAQNGIKYRSICAECNNVVLGSNLDEAYKDVFEQIKNLLESKLILPDEFSVECSVNKLARAVAGHMLAAKNFYDEECTVDKQLREYVLDESALPPSDMHMYYYPYPYNTTFIARDVVLMKVQKDADIRIPDGMISCINSYPVAFILTDGKQEMSFPDLFRYCDARIDSKKRILINKHTAYYEKKHVLRHPMWPCNVEDGYTGVDGLLAGVSANDIVFSRKKII